MTGASAGQIQILLKMVDQASAPMQAAAGNVDRATGGMSASFGKLAAMAGMATASAAITAFGSSAISAASDLNESMNKVNVVFKDSAQEIKDWASTAADNLGLSTQAAIDFASNFGAMFEGIGKTSHEAAGMSEELIQRATDLASIYNLNLSDAIEKVRSGLVGEAEPLRSLNVFINEAAVATKAAQMGFKGVNGVLTESEKIQARYALIMDQTSVAAGDFKNTSDGLANSQRILGAKFDDLKAKLGQGLLPMVTQVVQVLIKLAGVVADAPAPVQKAIAVFGLLAAGLLALTPIMIGAGLAFDVMLGPVGLVVLAITAVIAIIAVLVTNWDTITAKVPQLATALDVVKAAFQVLWAGIQFGLQAFIQYMKIWWDVTSNVGGAIGDIFTGLGRIIADALTGNVGDIDNAWNDLSNKLTAHGVALAHNFEESATAVIDASKNMASGVADAVTQTAAAADRAKTEIIGMRDAVVDTGTLTEKSTNVIEDGLRRVGASFTKSSQEAYDGLQRVGSGLAQYNSGIVQTTALSLDAANMLARVGSGFTDVATKALSWGPIQAMIDQNVSNASGALSEWSGKLSGAQQALDILDETKKKTARSRWSSRSSTTI